MHRAKKEERMAHTQSRKMKGKQKRWGKAIAFYIFHIIMYSDGLSNPLHSRVFHLTLILNRLQVYEIYLRRHKWCTIENKKQQKNSRQRLQVTRQNEQKNVPFFLFHVFFRNKNASLSCFRVNQNQKLFPYQIEQIFG